MMILGQKRKLYGGRGKALCVKCYAVFVQRNKNTFGNPAACNKSFSLLNVTESRIMGSHLSNASYTVSGDVVRSRTRNEITDDLVSLCSTSIPCHFFTVSKEAGSALL